MILDQVFFGVLNESEGTLEVYDEPIEDVSCAEGRTGPCSFQPLHTTALDTIKQMGDVVKSLYDKVSLAIDPSLNLANDQASGV